MPKHDKMSDAELIALINQEKAIVDHESTNLLEYQREAADIAYTGGETEDVVANKGRARVIDNAIQPAVDSLCTYLTKTFCSDKETIVFTPTNPNLGPVAKQTMMVVNHILHKMNNGYDIFNRLFLDSALHKNGIIKVVWEEEEVSYKRTFTDEIALGEYLIQKEQEGIECDTEENDDYSITVTCKYMKGYPRIQNVAPEEFLINELATAINDDDKTRFVAQRKIMYVGDVVQMFPKVDPDDLASNGGVDYLNNDYEVQNRHSFDGTYNFTQHNVGTGPLRQVELTESWVKADRNGDGHAEWRHVFSCGNKLIEDEEWTGPIPFGSFCYWPIPHKFYGLGIYDKLKDYHTIRTALLRSEVDSAVLRNVTRLIADPKQVDMRDLASGRQGIVKARPGFKAGDVQMIPSSPGSQGSGLQLLQYVHQQIIGQIGIDPITGVVSAEIEKSGNDESKTNMAIDNASAKIERYCREFAENCLRPIVWQVVSLLIEHRDEYWVKKLCERFTPEAPELMIGAEGMAELMGKEDLTAKVGLGHQTQQGKMLGIQQIQQQQAMLMQSGMPVMPDKQLNLAREAAKAVGYENFNEFLPTDEEAQQALQQKQQMAQQQQQMAQQQQQMQAQQMQAQMQEMQAKIAKLQAEAQAKQIVPQQVEAELALKQQGHDHTVDKDEADLSLGQQKQDLDEAKAQAEYHLELTQKRPADI